MRTILVSGASGIVGYGILRSLRRADSAWRLIGSSIHADSVAPGFCDVFELAPPTSDAAYMDWLLGTIAKHRIDLVVPGIEIDVYDWADRASVIQASGAVAVLNTPRLVQLCKDKWRFYEALRDAGAPCAIETSLADDFDELERRMGLPFLLKPRRGFGSKGIVRVDSRDTFEAHRNDVGVRLMAQPIVGRDDEEFTTSAFCDGAGGYSAVMTLRRSLSKDGFTDKAEVVPAWGAAGANEFSAGLAKTIGDLCQQFRPVGPTNFQFRRCGDEWKLLEINPRISSSTSIRAAFGYNESAMCVDYFLDGRTPLQPAIRRGRAVRYVDEQVFYEDGLHL